MSYSKVLKRNRDEIEQEHKGDENNNNVAHTMEYSQGKQSTNAGISLTETKDLMHELLTSKEFLTRLIGVIVDICEAKLNNVNEKTTDTLAADALRKHFEVDLCEENVRSDSTKRKNPAITTDDEEQEDKESEEIGDCAGDCKMTEENVEDDMWITVEKKIVRKMQAGQVEAGVVPGPSKNKKKNKRAKLSDTKVIGQ